MLGMMYIFCYAEKSSLLQHYSCDLSCLPFLGVMLGTDSWEMTRAILSAHWFEMNVDTQDS